MSPSFPRTRVHRNLRRRKDVLPLPLLRRVRIFPVERIRQIDLAKAQPQIALMDDLYALEMILLLGLDGLRQHRHAILLAFAFAHDDLISLKVDVFNAQAQGVHQSQARAVQERRNQIVDAI